MPPALLPSTSPHSSRCNRPRALLQCGSAAHPQHGPPNQHKASGVVAATQFTGLVADHTKTQACMTLRSRHQRQGHRPDAAAARRPWGETSLPPQGAENCAASLHIKPAKATTRVPPNQCKHSCMRHSHVLRSRWQTDQTVVGVTHQPLQPQLVVEPQGRCPQ